jgi:hypothetical protein
MKFLQLFAFVSLLLFSCQSEVCKCADDWYDMTQALKKADTEKKNIEPILKKYEQSMAKCRDMDAKKTPQQKEEMIAELKTCSSYQKLGGNAQ